MKLLFDQNLSPRLCDALAGLYPRSAHVRHLGVQTADDVSIWDYAARNGFAVVTKDADFRQRSLLLGFPPKVVWLRVGNCSTTAIVQILQYRVRDIEAFLADEQHSFLGLS